MSGDSRVALLERYGRLYGELGLAVTFTECVPGGDGNPKRVSLKGWQRTEPLPDGDFGAGLLRQRGQARNPAVVLRPSGLIGVETDTPERLEQLRALGLPETVEVQSSAPHKRHYWFRPPNVQPEFVAFRFEASGVTADRGRYLVCPPALHPSGVVYEFVRSPEETAIATLPEAQYAQLIRLAGEDKRARQRDLAADPDAVIPESARHTTYLRMAGAIRHQGASLDGALNFLLGENKRRGNPPWPDDDVERLVRDVYSRYPAGALPSARPPTTNGAQGAELEGEPVTAASTVAPYALTLDDFLAEKSDSPLPLLGRLGETVLPTGGLAILAGKPGASKTTLAVDGAFHLASGREWLGVPVERPLRVLIVENEGPREPFRQKLERKRETWPHELTGAIFVHALRWGGASFVNVGDDGPRGADELRAFVEQEQVNLVIGDPLSSLGVNGVGSPADVREFMLALRSVGLFDRVAFLFVHHFRHGSSRNGNSAKDELDELSGAWGGYPDALMMVSDVDGGRLRLSFRKLRWSDVERRPLILARRTEDASFEVVAEEGASERELEGDVLVLLSDGVWRTVSEIARPKEKGGVGAGRKAVQEVLDELTAASELDHAEGPPGRAKDAKCWRVAQPSEQPETTSLFAEGSGVVAQAPTTPVGGEGLDNPTALGLLES